MGEVTPFGYVEDSPAAALPVVEGGSLPANLATGWEASRRVGNLNAAEVLIREETAKRIKRIEAMTGQRLPNPYRDRFDDVDERAIRARHKFYRGARAAGERAVIHHRRRALEARIDAMAEQYPDIETEARFRERLALQAQSYEAQLRAAGLAGFAGAVAASFTDPVNVATLPFGGGGRTIAQAAFREAALNAGLEIGLAPMTATERARIGLETTPGDIAFQAAAAGAFGGVVGGGAKALEKALAPGASRREQLDAAAALADQDEDMAAAAIRLGDELSLDVAGGAVDIADVDLEREVADLEAELLGTTPRPDPVRDELHAEAVDAAEDWAAGDAPEPVGNRDVGTDDPGLPLLDAPVLLAGGNIEVAPWDRFHGDLLRAAEARDMAAFERLLPLFKERVTYSVEGDERLVQSAEDLALAAQQWRDDIIDGVDGETGELHIIESPEAMAAYNQELLSGVSLVRIRETEPERAADDFVFSGPNGVPIAMRTFRPAELMVDAATFQFKSGGDDEGVTDVLGNITIWDPVKAGDILVWERKDGSLFVADGHQRTGLARRLAAQGQDIVLRGFVYREADGISAADARVIAAAVNLARGTGSTVDAAKVLRVSPELLDGSLNPRTAFMREAIGLRGLGDEAFGMIINEVASPRDGAIVGRLVDDPAEQASVLGLLARADVATQGEAENLVRDALASGFVERETENLFGTDAVAENLLIERSRILGGVVKALRRDKRMFRALDRDADDIEAAGNRLSRDTNREEARRAETITEAVQRSAYTAGPVADSLKRASRQVTEGGVSRAEAVRRVVSDLRALGPDALVGLARARDSAGRGGGEAVSDRADATPQAPGSRVSGDDQPELDVQRDQLTRDLLGEDPGGMGEDGPADIAPDDAGAEPPALDPDEPFITELGEDGVRVQTRAELAEEIRQEQGMFARLEECIVR